MNRIRPDNAADVPTDSLSEPLRPTGRTSGSEPSMESDAGSTFE